MRTAHVIDSLTLKITVNGYSYELTLCGPADVYVDSHWQPADGPYRAEAVADTVTAADVMLFDSDGVSWSYAAGEDLTRILPKSKIESFQNEIEERQGVAA